MFRPHALVGFILLGFPATAHAATGDVVSSFPSSFASPDGLMWDGESLWATDCAMSRIDKIDPSTGSVIGAIDIPGVYSDEMAWDGESFWISDHAATEMPDMSSAPPRIYRVDPVAQSVLGFLEAPGKSKYPMGVAWDGEAIWNVDTWDKLIYRLDPDTGEVLRSIPSPANGSCGMTWDGACLWLTDAATNGLIYHLDPQTGEVLRSFDGPGGIGHQTTGIAWDGVNLWVHDEAKGRAAVYKLAVDDITEGGRCAGALGSPGGAGAAGASGAAGSLATGGAAADGSSSSGGCSIRDRARGHDASMIAAAFGLLVARRRRRQPRLPCSGRTP
jgi:DNA-binding beta-propeller fold protein YncE